MNAVLAASRPRVGTSSLAGLGLMAGFFLRRNWIRLVVWLAVVVVMMDVVAAYYKSQFNTPTALGERAMLAGSVGMRTVFGTVTSTGLGAAVWSEMWMFTACLLAIGMAFLVTRNNREAERQVARGEYALYFPQQLPYGLALKGLPIRMIAPREGWVYASAHFALLAGAPHPNAARLLANFMLEPESQLAFADAGLIPVTKGIIERANADARPFLSEKLLGGGTYELQAKLLALAAEIYK